MISLIFDNKLRSIETIINNATLLPHFQLAENKLKVLNNELFNYNKSDLNISDIIIRAAKLEMILTEKITSFNKSSNVLKVNQNENQYENDSILNEDEKFLIVQNSVC